jgi:hypothetical protein
MRGVRLVVLGVFACGLLNAQEMKYVDLTVIQQRTELRNPPAPAVDCEQGKLCVGGAYGGGSVGDGAPNIRDPHALGVYLLSVKPIKIDPTQPFEVEFRVLNTGLAPIELPVSPNLSDLQPGDQSVSFNYFSLALAVRGELDPPRTGVFPIGFVELYGSKDHEGTLLVLKPGEWIRVRGNVKLSDWPLDSTAACLRGEFWLRSNTLHPHPGGQFTAVNNLYPNATPTPKVKVHFVPAPSDNPER